MRNRVRQGKNLGLEEVYSSPSTFQRRKFSKTLLIKTSSIILAFTTQWEEDRRVSGRLQDTHGRCYRALGAD